MKRRKKAKKGISTTSWEVIDHLIAMDWSPEQISGYLEKEQESHRSAMNGSISIFTGINGLTGCCGSLRCRKKHRKRYGSYEKRGQIPERVWIDERPQVMEQRERLGDWEADTIISQGKQK